MMKFAIPALLLISGSAFAAGIGTSKHDLSVTGDSSDYGVAAGTQVCVYCHTPHNAGSTDAPLWNKAATQVPIILNKLEQILI